jgi:hypothetical protein
MRMSLVPVNLSAADAHAAAGLGEDIELPVAPTVDQLSNWSQEAYSLDVSEATNLGFPVGNLSMTYKRQALMFGSSRWKDVTSGGRTYRFGVALRAIIVVSNVDMDSALTLPVVAAKVEIEGVRATAQLIVRGYKSHKLAESLPTWQSFGVDSYAAYMKSVSNIQKIILEDEDGIVPELLATTVLSPRLPTAHVAVAKVYAIHAIADGQPLARAIEHLERHLGSHESAIANTIEDVYREMVGEDRWAAPNYEQREEATKGLCGLHLGRRLPWTAN